MRASRRPRLCLAIKKDGSPWELGLSERCFQVAKWLILASTAGITILDMILTRNAARVFGKWVAQGGGAWTWIAFVLVLLASILVTYDLATYRPRLFAASGCTSKSFFENLAKLNGDLSAFLPEVRNVPAATVSEAKAKEEALLSAAHQFLVLDTLRFRMRWYIIQRVVAILGSLGLMGYWLSYGAGGTVVGMESRGLGAYLYYTMVTFFTVGYGDFVPSAGFVGYVYCALILAGSGLVLYFILTDLVAGEGQFASTLRSHAANYVLMHSSM